MRWMGTQRVQMKGVAAWLGLSCRFKRFLFCLGCSCRLSKKYLFPHRSLQYFNSFVPIVQQAEPEFVNLLRSSGIDSLPAGRNDNPIWRTRPPGYIGWRNRFLGIDSWAVLWNRNYLLRFRFRFWLLKSYGSGSGSGSGSNFWKVMVPVPVPLPTFKKVTVPVPVPVPAPYLDHKKQ